jgi:hypothetical protein
MDDRALSDEIRGKLLDKLIALTKERVSRLRWQPFCLFGNYGYLSYYDKYSFYIDYYHDAISYYDLYIIEGKPTDIEAISRIHHSKNKELWRTIKELPPIDESNLMYIMGLEEDKRDPSLCEGEKRFLAEQYSPGTFVWSNGEDNIQRNLFKKGYLTAGGGALEGMVGLTEAGRIVAKKCWEELNE